MIHDNQSCPGFEIGKLWNLVGQLTYDFGAKIQAYVSEKEHCGIEKKS